MSNDPQHHTKRAWRKNNPENNRASNNAYYQRNRLLLKEKNAAYRILNREKIHARAKAKRDADPSIYREYNLRRRLKLQYGISPEQKVALFDAQNRRCAICKSDEPRGHGHWHIDHDHATKRVRGILCHFCNIMLGQARDSVEILQSAINYLNTNVSEILEASPPPFDRRKRHAFRHEKHR